MSSAEGDKSYKRFYGEKYPRVDKDEITRVNRDLVTGAASIFDAIDLQKKAERVAKSYEGLLITLKEGNLPEYSLKPTRLLP